MLLCINARNSIISFGCFDNAGDMVASFDISSDARKTSDEYLFIIKSILKDRGIDLSNISGAILSSVVPALTDTVIKTVVKLTGRAPLAVGPGVKTGFHIKIDNPSELGADMVANTAAAVSDRSGGRAVIVADLGVVNTLSAINKKGEYVGCAILPGTQLSFDMLHSEAALLPSINSGNYATAIGKNSQGAVRSGVLLGAAIALDGLALRFCEEMGVALEDTMLIATGSQANDLLPRMKSKFSYDEHLTLRGLYCIYKNNHTDL